MRSSPLLTPCTGARCISMRQTMAERARSLELLLLPMLVRRAMVSAVAAAAALVETYKFCPGLALA
jgi:hypothetical protein